MPSTKSDVPYASVKGISISDEATVLVTSEICGHPIEHIFDDQHGPGSTKWIAGEAGDQSVIVAFDRPHSVRKVILEVEETEIDRTQEVTVAISHDWGQIYREVLRQEYNFSPPDTTFEREEWSLPAVGITNLWIWIRPDKGNTLDCRATISSLMLQ
jgi:hypothetical protein